MLEGKWDYVLLHWCIARIGPTVSTECWYQVFLCYICAVHETLASSVIIGVFFCNKNCRVKLFLNWCPIVVQLHLLLVTIRKWCQDIPSHVQMDAFTLTVGRKSWKCFHLWKLETMLCSCSTKALKGYFCSLTPCRDQASCSGRLALYPFIRCFVVRYWLCYCLKYSCGFLKYYLFSIVLPLLQFKIAVGTQPGNCGWYLYGII